MRSLVLSIAVVGAVAVAAVADDDGALSPVIWKYTSRGLTNPDTLHADGKDACKQWATYRTGQGYPQTYVTKLPSTDPSYPGSFDCVFKNEDNQPWTQSHGAEAVPTCPSDAYSLVSADNSGTNDSQRCKCNNLAACAVPAPGDGGGGKPPDPPAPPPDPPPPPEKKFPYAPDTSKRCQDNPKVKPTNARAAKKKSEANKKAVAKDPKQAKIAAQYNKSLEKTRLAEAEKQPAVRGGSAFPDFSNSVCETGGPTDVNIGLLCGSRAGDKSAANNLAGYSGPQEDDDGKCVWHHHEELGRMVLVKEAWHQKFSHKGSAGIWAKAFNLGTYP